MKELVSALVLSLACATVDPLPSLGIAHAQAGTVVAEQKISATEGGFGGVLDNEDFFGWAVGAIGDLDGDGIADFVAGAPQDDDGYYGSGAAWVLFLNATGTVRAEQKISSTEGAFVGPLHYGDWFGSAFAHLGDINGDGKPELAVGASADNDGGSDTGAIWILSLNSNGTVSGQSKISAVAGGFSGAVESQDRFGSSLANLGDLDGDGVNDIAAGAYLDDDGALDVGAVWILFLNADGSVKAHQKISAIEGGFTGGIGYEDWFGVSVSCLGDLDGDGTADLAVGAWRDDDGGTDTGAVWILFLRSDGTVKAHQKIGAQTGGFGGVLGAGDRFGRSVASLQDQDGDGVRDLAVGAENTDDGAGDSGAVWILLMNPSGTVHGEQKISNLAGGFGGTIPDDARFGSSVASVGDVSGDGFPEVVVGSVYDDDGGNRRGASWVLFLQPLILASATFRNSGSNPPSYSVVALPILGRTYTAVVDLGGTTRHSFAQLWGYGSSLTLTLGGGQVLLINPADPSGEVSGQPVNAGPIAWFDLPIPADIALAGFQVSTQAVHFWGVRPWALSNAQDLVLGF